MECPHQEIVKKELVLAGRDGDVFVGFGLDFGRDESDCEGERQRDGSGGPCAGNCCCLHELCLLVVYLTQLLLEPMLPQAHASALGARGELV